MADEFEEVDVWPLLSFRLREGMPGTNPRTATLQFRFGGGVHSYLVSAEHLRMMAQEFLARAAEMKD